MSARSLGALGYLVLTAVVALPAYDWLLAVTSPAAVEALGRREAAAAGLGVCGVMLPGWPRRT